MATLQRGRLLAATLLLLLLTTFNCSAITDVAFDMTGTFNIPAPYNTNRTVKIQQLSPFSGNFFWRTSDVSGVFYISNAQVTTYSGTILAPPNSLTFSIAVTSTNLGTISATGITAIPANGVQTFPAGQTSWSIQASDSRYAFSTNGPSAGVNASQVTNIVLGAIPSVFWNPVAASWVTNLTTIAHLDTNTYQPGVFMSATTNSAGVVTFNVANLTNGFSPIVFSNATGFYPVSNPSNYATLTQTTNIALNATNSLGSAAYFPSNAWYPNSNPLFFLGSNIIQSWIFNSTNNIGLASGFSAYVPTNRFDTNGAAVWLATLATNGIGVSSGLSAFVSTNIFATSNNLFVTSNALQSQIVGGSITASGVTNIASFLIGVSNAPLSASNSLLFVGKVDSTNGFSTGERATNFNVKGSIGLGDTGQATNIVNGTTNLVKFINAGSSQATNGVFIWTPSLGCYTNWITMAIWTNTGSGWVMITNGVSLYSLSGASPFGASSTVSGSAPAPLAVPTFYLDHNGMQDVGFLSVTGLTSFVTNTVNMSGSNAIANFQGFGTNTYLTNASFSWNNLSPMRFEAAQWGKFNSNSASGDGAAILSGATNRIVAVGASVIVGGAWNSMTALSQNDDVIVGGLSNSYPVGSASGGFLGGGFNNSVGASFAFLGGGQLNQNASQWGIISGGIRNTNTGIGSAILFGASNSVSGAWSGGMGRNVNNSNDNSFVSSDGLPFNTVTNAQFLIHATNGVGINTNFNGTNALAVNGNVDASGMSIQGTNLFALFGGSASFVTASNFLGLTKLNITNDTSYGQTASNLNLRGRTSFNQATNFMDTTNVIKFYQAGTSVVTNGSYEWVAAMNLYTNRSTALIITNTGSQWVVSISGSGVYSSSTLVNNSWAAIGGSGTASSCTGFWQVGDGQVLLGFISSTNLNWQITNAVAQGGGGTSLATITNVVNFIATNNYLKTNSGTARNPTFQGVSTWTNASAASTSTTITSNAVSVVSVAVDGLGSKSSSTISLVSNLELSDSSIQDQFGNSLIDPDGLFTGNGSSITNIPPFGISTNSSTIGQVLANVGSGIVGFTNISGGSVGPSLTTNLMVWTNQPTFTVGQTVVITGTNANGSLVLKATNVWSVAGGTGSLFPPDAVGILTNNGAGITNWTTAIPYVWIIGASNAINASSNSLFATTLAQIAATNNNVVIPSINSSSNLNYVNTLIAISATNNALPAQTNFWGVTNSITRGQAVVVDGTNAAGVWQLKGTNWPSGGGAGVTDPLTNNFGLIQTNANTASTIITSNSVLSIQTNGAVKIVADPTVGLTINTGASNFFGGVNWIATNVSPYLSTNVFPYSDFTASVLYTNDAQRTLLVGNSYLLSGLSGSANITLFYTNNGVGYSLPMQAGAGVALSTYDIIPFCVLLSTNATFTFTPSMGSGASGFVTNVVKWRQ